MRGCEAEYRLLFLSAAYSQPMSNGLPQYDAPPVIETVLSTQFGRLPSFTLAHAGWFWKNYLDESWVSAAEAARLGDVFERFGDERVWTQHAIQFVPMGTESHRLQILRDDQERMIQVQNTRFIQNWRKREGGYRKLPKASARVRRTLCSVSSIRQKRGIRGSRPQPVGSDLREHDS